MRSCSAGRCPPTPPWAGTRSWTRGRAGGARRTAVSQHLTVLKNAGLISERRSGTRRLYRARPEGLDRLRRFLDDLWASSLDMARRLVEAERGITDDSDASAAG